MQDTISQLDAKFANLAPYRPRKYIPESVDLSDLDQVQKLFNELLDKEIGSVEALKGWLEHQSEVGAALDEYGSILYVKMTCQTDHEPYAKAYEDFLTQIIPEIEPLGHALNEKYLAAVEALDFHDPFYAVHNRSVQTAIELFVEKNIPLSTKISLISQEYQKVSGALTVDFDGQERTMPEMSKFLHETDRDVRERAWRAMAERRSQEAETFEKQFDEMLKLRQQVAVNAGFDHFTPFRFKLLQRFDYTPADCKDYHATVEEVLMPLWEEILTHRKNKMGLKELRPWDMAVDPLGRDALKPFESSNDLIKGCGEIFQRIDPDLGRQFREMSEMGLLDLENRKGKAPGGYQTVMGEARKPFIFMNSVGLDSDVRTLLHESGHAFHSLACAHFELADYRHAPMEFCEVASMAMELFADNHLDVFYPNPEDKKRSVVEHLEDVIFILIWVATIDAFQHWIYENPEHTRQQRREKWLEIRQRFGGNLVSWEGLEEEHALMWHKQLHIFEVPFYYIEYGIAQLGALQLWRQYRIDPAVAVAGYRDGLSVGGSLPLPEIFSKAGIKFDFSRSTIEPLAAAVREELQTNYHT